MTETNGEFYSHQITTTPPQPTGDQNYAHSISSSGGQDNTAANNNPGSKQPETLYLEFDEPSAPPAPVTDQALRTPAPSVPSAVPPNQTTNFYPATNQTPFSANHNYVPEQQPPPYNQLYGKQNPGFNGPQVHQPQPWGQPIQPNVQSDVVVTSQPQPVPPNVVYVSSPPQRNPNQGLAITSLVLAILGIFCCFWSICCTIPGIIFAAISLGNSTDPDKAKTHAKISITCTVIGWISGIIVVVIYIVWVVSFFNSVSDDLNDLNDFNNPYFSYNYF